MTPSEAKYERSQKERPSDWVIANDRFFNYWLEYAGEE